MKKAVLKAGKRKLFGKRTRFLRRDGIVPANVYGQGVDSLALELGEKDLELIIKGGTSRIILLDVEGENNNRNVLIKNVSRHSLSQSLVHVDLYQVNMSQKISADIPVLLIGQAPALEYSENFLDHQLNEIQIECLPDKLPPHIEVDISVLTEAGQTIYVSDLQPEEGVEIITPGDHAIVRVTQSAKDEAEEGEEEKAVSETEVVGKEADTGAAEA
ncbi:MAG: 50S ribosomal protein L25 [Dehalococcoidales bacterium]|jgi:large subunit ribosomal protein L25|nr:50S ribosomal protein L25 [Dehalococcoidales bacterium]MDX9986622.1 50S ribosomal protein L25 [Dehalococcoidales bacterium]